MDKNKKTEHTKDEEIHIDGRLALAVLMTFVMLIGCLIPMFVGLAMDMNVEEPVVEINGGTKPNKGNETEKQEKPVVSQVSSKTGIKLPCATNTGTYLSVGSGAMIDGITSQHGALVNLSTNTLVAGKDADVVIHPASMTKVMTLLVACENAKNPMELLTVTQDMVDRRTALDGSGELVDNTTAINANGDSEQIMIVGKSVTVEDALHLINYQSDTVACLLVATYVAGSEEAFVEMMNQKAQQIGLTNTNFVNCTGLTEKNKTHNTTTCREMAAIMACALKNDVAKNIITAYQKYEKYQADIYDDGKKQGYYIPFYADWYTRNTRLNNNPWAGYVKILGGKTGYEDISGSCFVTYGIHDDTGTEYVCVTVGKSIGSTLYVDNKTSTADTRAIYKKYAVE